MQNGGDLVRLGGTGFPQPDCIVLPAFSALTWNDGGIRALSTADVTISIAPGRLLPGRGALTTVRLLEGQTIHIP